MLQPYLHQSRHNHAARRIRGPGGRFLTSEEVKALQASGELSGTSNSASLSNPDKPSDSQGQAESPAQKQQQRQQQQLPQRVTAGPSNLVCPYPCLALIQSYHLRDESLAVLAVLGLRCGVVGVFPPAVLGFRCAKLLL